jgi:type IV pilus assembly protein PilM
MVPYGGTVWAIEIGNDSLKALRLGVVGGGVQVLGFGNVEYGKILAGSGVSDAERDELIALSLRRFLRENSIGKEDVIVSVPSQTSFARFVNLPPVEEKKIPQVVRLEAGMQIPFDMSEVQWDWQLMSEAGAGQVRVGIFAIKNEVVTKELEYFGNEDVPVNAVQMVPMALYNYVVYDRPELVKSDKEAVAVINIGTETTDLVVCSKSTVWQRCIPMGGNSFTRAIADAFKLNFEKAEKLKRTAAMSKYARQVFQAMRPVFTDFASEIQRSLGFFSSGQPDCKVTHVIALGGGTRLRGLLKYLGQTLQVPIEKPDAFKRLVVGEGVSAAEFGQRVGEFAVVYGLGLQELGLGKIESNLLPRAIASSMALASKAKYFTLAAAVLLAVVVLGIGRTVYDSARYKAQQDVRKKINSVIRDAEDAKRKLANEQERELKSKEIIDQAYKQFENREVVPEVVETVLSVLPNEENNEQQREVYEAFDRGDVAALMKTPRNQRKQIFVTSMSVHYVPEVQSAGFGRVQMRQKSVPTSSGPGPESGGGDPWMYMNPYRNATPGAGEQTGVVGSENKGETGGESSEPAGPGFVVEMSGYTPYKNVGELLDPAGVGDDKEKWGVVTRLMNLDALSDANSPFELYGKTDITHFQLETGEVSLEGQMPDGIGIVKEVKQGDIQSDQRELIDPMTKEVISKVSLKDELGRDRLDSKGKRVYEVNDHWFVLKFKLRWREAPDADTSNDV